MLTSEVSIGSVIDSMVAFMGRLDRDTLGMSANDLDRLSIRSQLGFLHTLPVDDLDT